MIIVISYVLYNEFIHLFFIYHLFAIFVQIWATRTSAFDFAEPSIDTFVRASTVVEQATWIQLLSIAGNFFVRTPSNRRSCEFFIQAISSGRSIQLVSGRAKGLTNRADRVFWRAEDQTIFKLPEFFAAVLFLLVRVFRNFFQSFIQTSANDFWCINLYSIW